MAERLVLPDGAWLCYSVRGDPEAPRLLYINGSMGDMRRPSCEALIAQLERRFRVATYDHRGMGRSAMDTDPAHYSMAGYADDADALLRHLGWDSCHVLGYSFGGMVAQELACRCPTRLAGRALVLAATSAGGAAGASIPLHELARLGDFEFARQFARAADTAAVWSPYAAGALLVLMPHLKHIDPGVRDLYWGTVRHLQFAARAEHNTADRLAAAANEGYRTLVIGGDRDGVASVEAVSNLARLAPRSTLRLFSGGHGVVLSDPRCLPYVADWIASGQDEAPPVPPLPQSPYPGRLAVGVAVVAVAVWATLRGG